MKHQTTKGASTLRSIRTVLDAKQRVAWWNPFQYSSRLVMPEMADSLHRYPVPRHSGLGADKERFRIIGLSWRRVRRCVSRGSTWTLKICSTTASCTPQSTTHGLASDGTGSLRSYWGALCFTYIWISHLHNPLNSEYMRDFEHLPFYGALMDRLRAVDEDRANQLIVSCFF